LLPVARELRRRGHVVAFLTAPDLGAAVAAEGFELLPAGPGLEALLAEAFRRHRDLARLPRDQVTGMGAAIPIFADTRVALTLPKALAAAQAWHPDLVVSEHADFAGPLVAVALGAARVTLGFGPGHPADWLARASDAVAPHYAAQGLTPPTRGGLYEGLYLDTCPPALQAPRFPRPAHTQLLWPEPHRQAGARWESPESARGPAGRWSC
jgi:hypothetical protein